MITIFTKIKGDRIREEEFEVKEIPSDPVAFGRQKVKEWNEQNKGPKKVYIGYKVQVQITKKDSTWEEPSEEDRLLQERYLESQKEEEDFQQKMRKILSSLLEAEAQP
jgi:hypothetical protein